MAMRPLRPCAYPSCPELVQSGRCDKHKQENRDYDRHRGSSTERGYNERWRKYRLAFLKLHPLCECPECRQNGEITPANVVDHIIPHKADYDLFWDTNNHQAMSKHHHDRKTAQEDGGFGRR